MNTSSKPSVQPHISTRRVMSRVILAGALFAGTIIYASSDTPQLATTGYSGNQIFLDLRDATPSRAIPWQKGFVPASERRQQQVLSNLASLGEQWQERGISVSVANSGDSEVAQQFAAQLDGWLREQQLNSTTTVSAAGAEQAADGQGFVIRCHEYQRPEAKALLLALSPLMRGNVAIEFSARAEVGKMAIHIDSAPSFDPTGIAYFPAVDA